MNDGDILGQLASATGARVEGVLRDGRFILLVTKKYAVLPPLQFRRYSPEDEIDLPTAYTTITVRLDISIDFYAMRDNFDTIAAGIRRELDLRYEEASK